MIRLLGGGLIYFCVKINVCQFKFVIYQVIYVGIRFSPHISTKYYAICVCKIYIKQTRALSPFHWVSVLAVFMLALLARSRSASPPVAASLARPPLRSIARFALQIGALNFRIHASSLFIASLHPWAGRGFIIKYHINLLGYNNAVNGV